MSEDQNTDKNQSAESRRDFIKTLGVGALAGGVVSGCNEKVTTKEKVTINEDGKEINVEEIVKEDISIGGNTQDLHICMGLNTKTEKGFAAGECECATAPGHSCEGGNACHSLGACGTGDYATQYWVSENACGKTSKSKNAKWDGSGGCGTPIGTGNSGFVSTQLNSATPTDGYSEDYIGQPVWAIARARFEYKMVSAGKSFGKPSQLLAPLVANEWDGTGPFTPTNKLPEPYPAPCPPKPQPGS